MGAAIFQFTILGTSNPMKKGIDMARQIHKNELNIVSQSIN